MFKYFWFWPNLGFFFKNPVYLFPLTNNWQEVSSRLDQFLSANVLKQHKNVERPKFSKSTTVVSKDQYELYRSYLWWHFYTTSVETYTVITLKPFGSVAEQLYIQYGHSFVAHDSDRTLMLMMHFEVNDMRVRDDVVRKLVADVRHAHTMERFDSR